MIDFDANTQEAFMSQDLAMKFLVWAAYYNDLTLDENRSFALFRTEAGTPMFSTADSARLDRIKSALYKCFGAQSVANATIQMHKAKQLHEPCPFSEIDLNNLFGTRQ